MTDGSAIFVLTEVSLLMFNVLYLWAGMGLCTCTYYNYIDWLMHDFPSKLLGH